MIFKAYSYAEKYHRGQTRQSGKPYIIHPLGVATILGEERADADTICAGLLHDTLEDTEITSDIIINEFNSDVYRLVAGVTKIKNTNFACAKDAQLANNRKLIVSITDDIRIIIIKLADRLDNMRSLNFLPLEKQLRIAKETIEIYVPLAEKIGAYQIKSELEDLAFKYLDPNAYEEILNGINLIKQDTMNVLFSMINQINNLLNNNNIPSQIRAKIKGIYEIYKSRINKTMKVDDIPNIFYLQVIVNDYRSCYETLGWIHSLYQTVDSMTKFYITNPKYPMHRAIHSTVINDKLIQMQIQTREMDLLSTHGLTALWQMTTDDVREQMQTFFQERFGAMDSLKQINSMITDDSLFMELIKNEVLSSDIVVFTPKGEKVKLPLGSSVIDFAYHIHSKLGDHLVSARVNDLNQSIFYQLENYDRIRVLTDFDAINCDPSWLDHIRTTKARKGINDALKRKEVNQVLSLNHL